MNLSPHEVAQNMIDIFICKKESKQRVERGGKQDEILLQEEIVA